MNQRIPLGQVALELVDGKLQVVHLATGVVMAIEPKALERWLLSKLRAIF